LRQYTWRRKNNNNIANRIDYFLISADIRSRIIKADIRPATISFLTTCLGEALRFPLKLYAYHYLVLIVKFVEIINQLISKYQKKLVVRNTDPRTLWDVLKAASLFKPQKDFCVYFTFFCPFYS
jgi:hypothetical protein